MDLSKHSCPLCLKMLINPSPWHMLLRKATIVCYGFSKNRMRKWNLTATSVHASKPGCHSLLPTSEREILTKVAVSQVLYVNSNHPAPSLLSNYFCLDPEHKIKNPNFIMQVWTRSPKSRWKQELKPVSLLCCMALFHPTLINGVWELRAQQELQSSAGDICLCSIIILRFLWRIFSPVIFSLVI